jgi:2-oxoglutarate dehydrogenase E1 component
MRSFDFIARANLKYVDALYEQYRRDPASVDERWALVFAGYEVAAPPGAGPPVAWQGAGDAYDLVHSYRELGHLIADLDPLGSSPRSHPLLRLEEWGFSEHDPDRLVPTGGFRGFGGRREVPLRELVRALQETYCATLAVEYLTLPDKAQREWLQERMEPTRNRPELSAEDRQALLERVVAAEMLEQFLHTKYVGQKRFSLEGGEALIPLLDTAVEEVGRLGADEMVIGMPHRGRLNVLAHLLGKPYRMIFAEFEGAPLPSDVLGDGDVKYHLGYSTDRATRTGRTVHLSLASNPSHLEAVDPVVEGMVRAKQAHRGDRDRGQVVPVLMHGDASFTGQGIVYETLALSQLPGFTTGGTLHVIVNNQIGFTTAPEDYVFTRYPSNPAKVIRAPVLHVNGDDPEAVVQAARLAAGFRQTFHTDVVIDFVCYRRHGHNELDDPTITQPVMYEQIRNHPSVVERYRKRLAEAGALDEARLAGFRARLRGELEDALAAARSEKPRQQVFVFGGLWKGLSWAGEDWSARTGVDAGHLRGIAEALARLPKGFTPHRRVKKLLDDRRAMVERGEAIDWGCGEMLAYGSLLLEKIPVRLTGQDSIRGTFSHRHAAVWDATDGTMYVPLNHLGVEQAEIELVNSLLSEAAVLGFEHGMASADPRRLTAWEAQFGDFANGAQVIIDQFISASESKWQRMSGLVMLLPHGYEGQGPEHSSARLERFLQLCAERNMQVVQPTTPAQMFHVLRRQVHRTFRKPLIVMTPKSLLRHPHAVSSLTDFTEGDFRLVIDDTVDPQRVRRLLFCSGKIHYALVEGRQERNDIAVVRVEQLYPFPAVELRATLARYAGATEFLWMQDEPKNQGAWTFVAPRLRELIGAPRALRYAGRSAAASPATGSYKVHETEEKAILDDALGSAGGGG